MRNGEEKGEGFALMQCGFSKTPLQPLATVEEKFLMGGIKDSRQTGVRYKKSGVTDAIL